jgi:hypothetical protein
MEFEVQATESFYTFVVRESVTVNSEDYPQLEGMSEEEAKEYIRWNASEMFKEGEENYSLWDELMEQGISHDKITGDETEVLVDGE